MIAHRSSLCHIFLIEIRPHSEYRWESLKQMMLRITLGNSADTSSIMLLSAIRTSRRVVRFAPTSKQPRVYPQGGKEIFGFTPIILSGERQTGKDLPLLIKKYRFFDFDEVVFDAAKG